MLRFQRYAITVLDNAKAYVNKKYDWVLVAGGSDFRAYEILRKFELYKVPIKNVIFFDFEERLEDLNKGDIEAYNKYKDSKFPRKIIPCSILDPSTCIKSSIKNELNFTENDNVAIDISCFTKPYFFSLMKYLKEQVKLNSISVFYTEPMTYIFPKGSYHSYHSSYGPLSVTEIPGYTGRDTRTTKKVLVVLLGFDGELSSFISEDIAPEEIIVINGFPAYSPKFKDISIINNERLINSEYNLTTKYARANNPFETFNLLEQLRKERSDAFFNIAPLGTKPMALGACLYAILYPSVRVVYPLPERYAKKTTSECYRSWEYIVPLDIECNET